MIFRDKKKRAFLLMIFCTIFISVGQLLWKEGIGRISLDMWWSVFNLPFIFGFLFYGFSAFLMLIPFKSGELSALYPILATSYVWVSLFSPLFFPDDSMNIWKWTGVGFIVLAVALLGLNGSTKEKVMVDG